MLFEVIFGNLLIPDSVKAVIFVISLTAIILLRSLDVGAARDFFIYILSIFLILLYTFLWWISSVRLCILLYTKIDALVCPLIL